VRLNWQVLAKLASEVSLSGYPLNASFMFMYWEILYWVSNWSWVRV